MLTTFITRIFSKPASERFDPSILPKSTMKTPLLTPQTQTNNLLLEKVTDELMEALYPSIPMYKSYGEMFAFTDYKDEVRQKIQDILSPHFQ
jgi:hypothetical protein